MLRLLPLPIAAVDTRALMPLRRLIFIFRRLILLIRHICCHMMLMLMLITLRYLPIR